MQIEYTNILNRKILQTIDLINKLSESDSILYSWNIWTFGHIYAFEVRDGIDYYKKSKSEIFEKWSVVLSLKSRHLSSLRSCFLSKIQSHPLLIFFTNVPKSSDSWIASISKFISFISLHGEWQEFKHSKDWTLFTEYLF